MQRVHRGTSHAGEFHRDSHQTDRCTKEDLVRLDPLERAKADGSDSGASQDLVWYLDVKAASCGEEGAKEGAEDVQHLDKQIIALTLPELS